MKLSMKPFTEKTRSTTYTSYDTHINGHPITVIDFHVTNKTQVFFQDHTHVEFENSIMSRASYDYSEWLLRKLAKIEGITKRLSRKPS